MGKTMLMAVATWYVVAGYSKLLTDDITPTEAIIAGVLGLVVWYVWGIIEKKEKELEKVNEEG